MIIMKWDLIGFSYVLIYCILSFEFRITFGIAQAEGNKRNLIASQIFTQLTKFVILGLYVFYADILIALTLTQLIYFIIAVFLYVKNNRTVEWNLKSKGYLAALSKNIKVNFASIIMQRFDVLLLMTMVSVAESVIYFAIASYAMSYQLISRALVTKILSMNLKNEITDFIRGSTVKITYFVLLNIIIIYLCVPEMISLLIDSYNDTFDLTVIFVFSQHLLAIYFMRYEGFFLKFDPEVVFKAKFWTIIGLILFVTILKFCYTLDVTLIALVFLLSRCIGWIYLTYSYRVTDDCF